MAFNLKRCLFLCIGLETWWLEGPIALYSHVTKSCVPICAENIEYENKTAMRGVIKKNSMIPYPRRFHPWLVCSWCLLHSSAVSNSTHHHESSVGLGAPQLRLCLPPRHSL